MILPRSFYARSTVDVARDLLGKVLVHGDRAAAIVETEAYTGGGDLAAHSAAGITDRTRVIFGPPGHAYVYLSYGIHCCFNVVAEPAGTPGCVLIRALEGLRAGPGRLTRAMEISRAHYGRDLTRGDLVVTDAATPSSHRIEAGPRVGITKSRELPYRFRLRPA